MPLRTPDQIDPIEAFFIKRTEQVVNQAFLWMRILKELAQQPLRECDIRREIGYTSYFYHRRTLQTSLYLLRTMKLVEKEGKTYKITPKGKQVLERAKNHLKAHLSILLK